MNKEREEILKLQEEKRRLNEFKSTVTEVFSAINIPVSGHSPSDNVEQYISQLQTVVRRVSPLRDQEYQDIQTCSKNAIQKKK
jgi:hypothetical protein